jgi:ribosomal protein S18 acetylase RimI-like enzyme
VFLAREDVRNLLLVSNGALSSASPAVDRTIELGRVIVAHVDNDLVRHVQLISTGREGRVEIGSLAVAEPYRRRGVGRALLARALDICRAERASAVTLSTATADIGNLRFYQRCGFRPVGIVRDAFTPDVGYPPGLSAEGIPVRDAIQFEHRLDANREP